ncbi:MAG: fructose-6-phosphate aldolase [Chloroflexi bacterium]|nr:MAG: fructose-6-phosphate aldolase [Chloroflexota bacterium]RLC79743.1 MAG: fructose-6-phosphate aldolase [Chloroflexota bacterium]HEY72573.1 fructose-6-phosphate aldolase [Thermoflexia bacterium]
MAQIFIDTASVEEIREAASWGVLDGVTTNPTLMMRAGAADLKANTLKIVEIVQGPVSAEVLSTNAAGMVEEARDILSWSEHVYVKIPTTVEGLKAMKEIASWPNGRINATLIFSPTQAYLVARAGASFASIFVGRMDDAGLDGMEVVRQTREIFDNYGFDCQVLAASIRHNGHVLDSLLAGADILTVPFTVLQKMIYSPFTDVGVERFLADWEKVAGKE